MANDSVRKIRSLEVRAVRVPMREPHRTASGAIGESPLVHVMKIGGVTGGLRAAALAQARALPMSNHLFPELSARLLCCTPTAHWLEYSDWWNPILAAPLPIENGMALVDATAGSGVEWNEDAVHRFAA